MPAKKNNAAALRAASPYSAVITREQFLFYETRATAKLMAAGLDEAAATERIVKENLFQYPTERSLRRMAKVCWARLEAAADQGLARAVATAPSHDGKQICLYMMMRQYRLVWDFMLNVVGAKYRALDATFGKAEVNGFFTRLQEQDDWVATWSDATIAKSKQVLKKVLVENGYLDGPRAERLNPVLLCPRLENAIRAAGKEAALPAFNCLN